MTTRRVDRTFLLSIIIVVLAGFFIFSSAALGILTREGLSYPKVLLKQIMAGGVAGGLALYLFSKIHYTFWKKWAFWLFGGGLFLTALVFIPHVGFSHGGATRWIQFGPLTFEPVEILKLVVVIYFAAWLAKAKGKVSSWKQGFLPFLVILGICGLILLLQPDTGNLIVIGTALAGMFIVAGGKIRYLIIFILLGAGLITVLYYTRPYVRERIQTFINPAADSQGSGYQIQQSLIAIGNGGITGRGFGQSVQKFNFLPEPVGDSIFAVASEEFGFIGAVSLIVLYVFFAVRGLKISANSPDLFGGLLALGIAILIISQAFLNIGGMLGVLPLKGIPLTFISQGGSAILIALAEAGIILNISRYQKSHS